MEPSGSKTWGGGSGLSPLGRVAAILVVLVGVLAMMLGGTAAFGAARATAFAPCLAVGGGSQVHFLLDQHTGPRQLAASGATISGLDPGTCDGQSATITLSGNAAGDPKLPADEPLAVWSSSLDPCSGQPLSHPPVVVAGTITLHGCLTVTDPARASYLNIHDATLMQVQVNGQDLPTSVEGLTITKPDLGPAVVGGTSRGTGGSAAALPFTGTWAALTFWLGLLLLLTGIVTFWLGHRRSLHASEPNSGS